MNAAALAQRRTAAAIKGHWKGAYNWDKIITGKK